MAVARLRRSRKDKLHAPRFPLTKTTRTAAYLTISAIISTVGVLTYAAVAAKISDLFAVVSRPTLMANTSM